MKVLITGGNGAIARAIGRQFQEVLLPDRNELDVTDYLKVISFIEEHKPDVLVNCAGYIKPGTVKDQDLMEWEKQISVNFIGSYFCIKAALNNDVGTIINIASSSGFKGRPEWGAYCASKAAVISLTETLAAEGVDAYCVSPHRVDTKMRHELFPDEDQKTLMSPSRIAMVVKQITDGKFKKGSHIEVDYADIKIRD